LSASTDLAAPEGAAVDATAASDDRQFVTFTVADELFAVPMAPVQEIIRVPDVARLPLAPPALDGLANLRGRVLPIVDMRRLFAIEPRAHDDATRAVVIRLGQPLGFVVDRVSSVVNIAPGELEPATQVRSVVRSEYLSGVINRRDADGHARLMMVLDFERLVHGQFGAVATAGAARDAGASAGGDGGSAADTGSHGAAADELRLVSFTASGQEYAIDIADVQEIVQVPEHIVSVPNTPAHVLGLMSLRQRLLPLVSLRSLFGLPARALGETDRIVVVALPGCGPVGLVTDAVKEVLSVPRVQADDVPGALSRDGALAEFESICRLDDGKRLVSIISTARLLGLQAVRDALAHADDASTDGGPAEDTPMNPRSTATLADDEQVVVFRLGAEEFGVPITSVQEIVRVPETLTRVPHTPAFVEGVINLRGTVLPVIDQRLRMGLPAVERNDRQRIMVYTLGGLRTGFIVDSVAEVLRIPQQQLSPAPSLSEAQGRLITQVARLDGDRRLVMLIDPAQMLGTQEARAVEAMAETDADAPAPLARAA
jgi:purine-binding chemotaxis protein CheW